MSAQGAQASPHRFRARIGKQPCTGTPNFAGISLIIFASSEAEADKIFNALAEGGQVRMPLGKSFFSPRFGMVADKFGVGCMVLVAN